MPSAAAVGAILAAAYALGTFPTAAVVARGEGHDPTAEGSGNPGASNVYRLAGARSGAAVLAGDLLKGVVAAGAGMALGGRGLGVATGAAAVVGHCFPLTRLRHGGKGVATAGGMSLTLFPFAALIALAAWGLVAGLTRKASLASMVAVTAFPVAVALAGNPGRYVAGLFAVSVLVIARHRDNIDRLLHGREPSLRADRTAA